MPRWLVQCVALALGLLAIAAAGCSDAADGTVPDASPQGRMRGDASEVRPPNEDELIARFALSPADALDGSGRPDEVEALPDGWQRRFGHALLDPAGPPVADGESRFVIELTDVLGPRSFEEAMTGRSARREPAPAAMGNAPAFDDGDDGAHADADVLAEPLVEPAVVTVRGRVRNRTGRDCARLLVKASYADESGRIRATGDVLVLDVAARGGFVEFELHLLEWPADVSEPSLERFHVRDAHSDWHP